MGISSSDQEYLGAPKKLGRSASGEAGWMSTPLLRRQRKPLISNRIKILAAGVLTALPAGYFVFGGDTPLIDVAAAPDPAGDAPFQLLPNVIVADGPKESGAPGRLVSEGATAPTPPPRDTDRPGTPDVTAAPSVVAAAPPPQVRTPKVLTPEVLTPEVRSTENNSEPADSPGYDPRCLPTPLSVRQSFPAARPSWTMNAPGHQGTKCWFAAPPRFAEPLQAASPGRPDTEQPADTADAARAASPERRRAAPLVARGDYDLICLPSAAAVRQNFPEARPSWTLWTPGHEGTQCWYPSLPRTALASGRSASNPLSLRAETEPANGGGDAAGTPAELFRPFLQGW